MTTRIEREQLQRWMDQEGERTLLEVLPERYYAEGHLPGARHFPLERIDDLAAAAIPTSETPVVVYCASDSCANSHQAAARLSALGYRDVQVYAGGKADWRAAGLDLER